MADSVRETATKTLQRYLNLAMRRIPLQTLLETTGRRSGEPRQTPIGGRRLGDEFWFVSEFGTKSQYVKNIQADPHVRVRLMGRWHRGTAHLLPDDDARARMSTLPAYNNVGVRTFGTNLLTVRVDLIDRTATLHVPSWP